MAFSQKHVRALTPDEMTLQAGTLVAKIVTSMHRADALLGGRWDRAGRDYWAFVKLQHGLPGLATAIQYVAATLGHFPATWDEFRHVVMTPDVLAQIKTHDPITFSYSAGFPADLHNAEETAAVLVDRPQAAV